jgi:hypothetical protein
MARVDVVCLSIAGGMQLENHRSPPPTWRTAALGEETEVQSVRQVPVGLVLWNLGRCGGPHCASPNRHRVAPPRISTVLDLESSPAASAAAHD